MYFRKRCIHCGICIENCPRNALTFKDGYVSVDRVLCFNCDICSKTCISNALELSGQEMGLEEILEIVMLDYEFYSVSGGGMTISGGEPFMQENTNLLLQMAKERGLNTAVETAGFASWNRLRQSLPYVDRYYYDIKCIDEDLHIRACDVSNTLILSNLEKLVDAGAKVYVRTPVIPGVNDNPDELKKIFSFVEKLGLEKPELLKFNKLGRHKYQALNRKYDADGLELFTPMSWDKLLNSISEKI